jgi:hypothetical protein
MSLGTQRHCSRLVCSLTLGSLMLSSAGPAAAALAPVRLWGSLGYDFRLEHFEEGNDSTQNAGILELNGASFIYAPWIATVEGGVDIELRRTNFDDGNNTTGRNVTGGGVLRLLPVSRYPLEIFGERTDSRTDSDLTGLNVEQTRYGFMQRYMSEDGAGYRLRYEHANVKNDPSGARLASGVQQDVSDLVQAAFNKSFGAHDVNFDSSFNRVDRQNSDEQNRSLFSALRHSYTPSPRLSAEDLLTYNRLEQDNNDFDFTNSVLQLNSFAFWRPVTLRPVRVNATLRGVLRTNESDGNDASAESGTATLGATYEWSPRWLFNANVGATGVQTEDDRQTSSFQRGEARYTSRVFRPLRFDASWFGQASVGNRTDGSDLAQEAGGEIGYHLGRSLFSSGVSQVAFDLTQSASVAGDTEDFRAYAIRSSVGLGWTRRRGARSSLLRAAFNDNRTWIEDSRATTDEGVVKRSFQLANLQASINQRLSDASSLSGNLTIQATRDDTPEVQGLIDENNGEWFATATADLSYFNARLFNVPRLNFRSTLRFVSDSYLPVLTDTKGQTDDGRDDKQWENRLEYSIGRIQLRLTARLSKIQGQNQAFGFFQIRRLFGAI